MNVNEINGGLYALNGIKFQIRYSTNLIYLFIDSEDEISISYEYIDDIYVKYKDQIYVLQLKSDSSENKRPIDLNKKIKKSLKAILESGEKIDYCIGVYENKNHIIMNTLRESHAHCYKNLFGFYCFEIIGMNSKNIVITYIKENTKKLNGIIVGESNADYHIVEKNTKINEFKKKYNILNFSNKEINTIIEENVDLHANFISDLRIGMQIGYKNNKMKLSNLDMQNLIFIKEKIIEKIFDLFNTENYIFAEKLFSLVWIIFISKQEWVINLIKNKDGISQEERDYIMVTIYNHSEIKEEIKELDDNFIGKTSMLMEVLFNDKF